MPTTYQAALNQLSTINYQQGVGEYTIPTDNGRGTVKDSKGAHSYTIRTVLQKTTTI